MRVNVGLGPPNLGGVDSKTATAAHYTGSARALTAQAKKQHWHTGTEPQTHTGANNAAAARCPLSIRRSLVSENNVGLNLN